MIKNIVIEGPNNVGKSTLISKLRDLPVFNNWHVERMTEHSPNTFAFYDGSLYCDKHILYDRHCIGELVYPILFSRNIDLTLDDVQKIMQVNNDTLFIFVRADYTFIHNAYKNKNEEIDWYTVAAERHMFDNIYNECKHLDNVLLFDASLDSTDNLIDYLNKIVE